MASLSKVQDYSVTQQIKMFLQRITSLYDRWSEDDVSEASQSMALKETHLPRLLTLTMTTLCLATIIFFVWAALTPVKELARTEGQLLPAGYSQLVQHLEGRFGARDLGA